jgi:hypothetical protein
MGQMTPAAALRAALLRTEEEFLQRAKQEQWLDGTTACVLLHKDGLIVHGNVGDSEAVLCRRNPAPAMSERRSCVSRDTFADCGQWALLVTLTTTTTTMLKRLRGWRQMAAGPRWPLPCLR